MKKYLLTLFACVATLGAFADDEWVGIGTGSYQPGILDFYEDEYSELMPASVYESNVTPGKYRFVPDPGFVGTVPGTSPVVVYDIIVHTEDPDHVWCEDATFFRGIMNLTTRQKVKETSAWDVEANYGKLKDGVITFSTPRSFQVVDLVGPKDSNLNGKFALYLPGKGPQDDPILEDTWQSIGIGRYVEGLMDVECRPGRNWEVEIEESVEHPGCYRLKPYLVGNPSFPNTPELANAYLYIHAEDDMEVYTVDCNLVNENGAGYKLIHRANPNGEAESAYFGTLEDGVITFPADSHMAKAINVPGLGTQITNTSGMAAIVLPGAEWQDYYLEYPHPTCMTYDSPGFCRMSTDNIVVGSGVSSIVLAVEPGCKEREDLDLDKYLTTGTTIPVAWLSMMHNMVFPMASDQFKTNRWTLVILAIDSKNNIKNSLISTFFTPENDNDWEEYAEAQYYDLFLSPAYTEDTQRMRVKVERNKNDHGRLRVVEPYSHHGLFGLDDYKSHDCDGHKHYLYINVTNPDYVYVEESPLGLDCGYGNVVASSIAGNQVNRGKTVEELMSLGVESGWMKDDEITFPEHTLCFFETRYKNYMLQTSGHGCLLKITNYVGVDRVYGDDNAAPAEYYDLRGFRIDNPQPGQLCIRKQGGKATKVVIN